MNHIIFHTVSWRNKWVTQEYDKSPGIFFKKTYKEGREIIYVTAHNEGTKICKEHIRKE